MSKDSRKQVKNIRKSENLLLRFIFKAALLVLAIGIQVLAFYLTYKTTDFMYNSRNYIYNFIRLGAVAYILAKHDSALYKIAWILFILFMPIVGICVYVFWGDSRLRRKKQVQIKDIENNTNYLFKDSFKIDKDIKRENRQIFNLLQYIQNITSYTVCKNSKCKYYNLGEKLFDDLIEDIRDAKEYIFLEYYIIEKGKLATKIFNILKEKAKQGVDVKIIYDSYGCLNKFPKKLREELKETGIEIYVFNPLSVWFNSYLNNRLHRKIIAIDGKVSYTGGVNLADEYANIKEKFGHWKDVGVRFEGDVSWNFALMFLRDLQFIEKKLKIDWDRYKAIADSHKFEEGRGIAVAMSDGPNNRKNPTEAVYMQIINTAKEYVYITSPYFAVSEEMLTSLLNAARSGVDVRLIFPHIPDKRIVQMVARSYYEVLLSAGVKVYEYEPGFIHSKSFVSDDEIAVIGSSNMDYRSMNLNYECSSIIYGTGVELDVKGDFETMINESCIEIKLNDWLKRPWITRFLGSILTAFSTMF